LPAEVQPDCSCFEPAVRLINPKQIYSGVDTEHSSYGEVSVEQCSGCMTFWLSFYIEYESFSRSGRWFRAPLPASLVAEVSANNAIDVLNTLTPRYAGGSYYDSAGFITESKVNLNP
jgi:hypothetical protein